MSVDNFLLMLFVSAVIGVGGITKARRRTRQRAFRSKRF